MCAMGVFDGIHRGHRAVIGGALQEAKDKHARCLIVTFDIDPDEMFGLPIKKLMSNQMRIEVLANLGIDGVIRLAFDKKLANMSPCEFLDAAFGDNTPCSIHVGRDFRFGHHASGDVKDLSAWGNAHHMEVNLYDLVQTKGSAIHSSRIRQLLSKGDASEANALLGHPYVLAGRVVAGRQAGREFGVRTANLEIPEAELALADGVYAGFAVVDGARYKAAVSVGIPPTFEDEASANVEAHLLDFTGDLYGKDIEIGFLKRLRPMEKFDSVDELLEAIRNDIAQTRALNIADELAKLQG